MSKFNLTKDQKTIAALSALLGAAVYKLVKVRREQAVAAGYIEGIKVMFDAQNGKASAEEKAE